MRITNKIMQSNTLYNINNNKILQDKLNTQITTKKTVTRPSDDPVIAIRSLRLRTNLDQVTQYYKKNVPDAENWLSLTESAIDTTTKVISGMIDEFRTGSKSSLKTSDCSAIIDALKEMKKEVYATGDADCAGRTIFTGYRTNYKLSFQEDTTQNYRITEQFSSLSAETFNHVNYGDIMTVNEANYNTVTTNQTDVDNMEMYRIQLAYGNLDSTVRLDITQTISYDPVDGSPNTAPVFPANVVTVSKFATPQDPYQQAYTDPDALIFVPETGELLLGKNRMDFLKGMNTEVPINITYEKTDWAKGDLRPEHYFACSSDGIDYNMDYLTKKGRTEKQVISYDVGFNQTLDVNTTADEVYYHGIGRCVDEMVSLLNDKMEIDTVVEKLEAMVGNANYNQNDVEQQLEVAKKAQTYAKENLQRHMEHGITIMQDYLDKANLALTNCGNRGMRLELVENRLSNQQASFTELTSKNDDADIAELAVKLSSAELTYNAALAATGKLLQTTLLNYI